jgi:hypothetical protein
LHAQWIAPRTWDEIRREAHFFACCLTPA